jgi:intein/homing endonuclease/serine acetyltransferase
MRSLRPYSKHFIQRGLSGDFVEEEDEPTPGAVATILYYLQIPLCLICIIPTYIPLVDQVYGLIAINWPRGIVGFWLRNTYYRTKVASLGEDCFFDQGCFPKGTGVVAKNKKYMEDGSNLGSGNNHSRKVINIEDIQVGDYVLSYNETTSEKELKRVTKKFVYDSPNQLYKLSFSNGNTLSCTHEHPFAIVNNGKIKWKKASNIVEGDRVIQYAGYTGLNLRLFNLKRKGISWTEQYGKKKAEKLSAELHKTGENNPFYGKHHSKETKREWSKKRSGAILSEEHKKKISDGVIKAFSDPNCGIHSQERSDKLAKYAIGRYRELGLAKQNKSEKKLSYIIRNVCPGEFAYNGDGRMEMRIAGHYPDFVNTNGKKKLIELYGCSWHCCNECNKQHPEGIKTEQIRDKDSSFVKKAARLGYQTLVIWEHEMRDRDCVKQKVEKFVLNPDVEIVKVTKVEKIKKTSSKVYNLEVSGNNNYFAEGILVHNCTIFGPNNVTLGHDVHLDERVSVIAASGKIEIGNYVHVAANCFPAGAKVLVEREKSKENRVGYCKCGCGGKVNREWQYKNGINDYIEGHNFSRNYISKRIDEIEVGDKVLSYNTKNSEKEYKEVTHVFNKRSSSFVNLIFSNGNKIRCTPEHPIAINRKGKIRWVQAKNIRKGDECIQYEYSGLQIRLNAFGRKGKTYDEIYGRKKGACVKGKIGNNSKKRLYGKTYVERYGNRRASEIKEKIRNKHIGLLVWNKGKKGLQTPWNKDLTKESDARLMEVSKDRLRKIQSGEIKLVSPKQGKFNNSERQLSYLLRKLFPGEYRYNGDGRLSDRFEICGHNADFVNVNGKKKLIEFNGCIHHCCKKCGYEEDAFGSPAEDIRSRDKKNIKNAKKYGFDTLTIWEHDWIKNRKKVEKQLLDYHFNPNVEIVKVKKVEFENGNEEKVYNLEVADNNNYFVFGILVHNCVLQAKGGIRLGHYSTCSANSRIYSATNYYVDDKGKRCSCSAMSPARMQFVKKQFVEVDDYGFLGACATIIPGGGLGKYSVAGSNSLVNRNIPDFEVHGGVPAKPINRPVPRVIKEDVILSDHTAVAIDSVIDGGKLGEETTVFVGGVVRGSDVGKRNMVGAHSVVVDNCDKTDVLLAGNPAEVVKNI